MKARATSAALLIAFTLGCSGNKGTATVADAGPTLAGQISPDGGVFSLGATAASADMLVPLTPSGVLPRYGKVARSVYSSILGQRIVEDVLAVVESLAVPHVAVQTQGSYGTARSTHLSEADCRPMTMELNRDGYGGTVTLESCSSTENDHTTTEVSIETQLQGSTAETAGKAMDLRWKWHADYDVCPSPDGIVTGSFASYLSTDGEVSGKSFGGGAEGNLTMRGSVSGDAVLEKLDLDFTSTISFSENGQSAFLDATSQAMGVAPDYRSVMNAVASNAKESGENLDGLPTPPTMERATEYMADALIVVGLMIGANESAQSHWQTVIANDTCLDIDVKPTTIAAFPGDTIPLEVRVVRTKTREPVMASLESSADNGTVSPASANTTDKAAAKLQYTAPSGSEKDQLHFKATSKAGRALLNDTPTLSPATYMGTIVEKIKQDTAYYKRDDVINARVKLQPAPGRSSVFEDAAPETSTIVTGDLWTLLSGSNPVNWSVCNGSSSSPGHATLLFSADRTNYSLIWAGPLSGTKTCDISVVNMDGTISHSTGTSPLIIKEVPICEGNLVRDLNQLQGSCGTTDAQGITTTLTWNLLRSGT